MRGLFRSFRFWLAFISSMIVIIEIFDFDEYGVLLAMTSPVMWISINYPAFRQIGIPIVLTYVLTIVFWFLVGFALDEMIKKLKSKQHD